MDVPASVVPEAVAGADDLLHQQLKLGVQVLQALEWEIAQARTLLDELDREAEEVLARRFARYERQISAREQALAQVDEQIAAAAERADHLARLVEGAEINIAVLAGRAARTAGLGK